MAYRNACDLLALNQGDERCFYCGNAADVPLKVADTFTDGWEVAEPESSFMCRGCVVAFNEKMIVDGKDKPQKFRSYSWHVTPGEIRRLTKGDKATIALLLLNPVVSPWSMMLAASGQKHLAYRTPVNSDDSEFVVRLELELIQYDSFSLSERIELCRRVVARVGHRGLASINVVSLGGELAEEWSRVHSEPLTRLALFVTPGKEECGDFES